MGVTTGAFFGQVFMTNSIKGAPVSVVSPFVYLTPVFGALFGFLFWGERLTPQAFMGGAIIIVCGILIYLLRGKPAFVPLEE